MYYPPVIKFKAEISHGFKVILKKKCNNNAGDAMTTYLALSAELLARWRGDFLSRGILDAIVFHIETPGETLEI